MRRLTTPALSRRPQLLLFLLCWITFGWFHQGGGWNQNARFAEVRAIVEQGTFAIDDFLIYAGDERRVAIPVSNGVLDDGPQGVLCWPSYEKNTPPVPARGNATPPYFRPIVIGEETATGDVGFCADGNGGGHFVSNKPPGTSLLAVPIYLAALQVEGWLGVDPHHWWTLTVNAWLCSIFTVGLASAIGVVLVWRLGASLFPEHLGAALAAALLFGFGTTFFPFATLLFDHNIMAVLLLGSFASVRSDRPFLAGALVGAATVVNYLAAIPGVAFGFWALARQRRHALSYIAGVIPPAIALLAYNTAALGSPFALNTDFQNPQFKETAPAFLGMFGIPSWFAAHALTFSPWRGIFVLSPVLVLAIVALFRWPKNLKAERRVIAGVAVFFFFVNICFNGFHGGMSAGPRYLIPALPFLCLALVPALARWPIMGTVLGLFSVAQQTLLTATDALNPVGISDHAWQNHPDEWKEKLWGNSIVWRYAWPVFAEGRAWPVIRAEFEEGVERAKADANAAAWASMMGRKLFKAESEEASHWRTTYVGSPHSVMSEDLWIADEAWESVGEGRPGPISLAAMKGPVSMNVVDITEGGFTQNDWESDAARWASFNVGEFLFPQSRWSLAPLAALWIALGPWVAFRAATGRRKRST